MGKIIQLEQHVADLIAAGEVVSRPASVVKELVENSIDAGAGTITVEIKNGGMAYIRVTDNGSGIDPSDAPTAFLRHATSKLRDARGLEAIETLGFRGEALAAISAVSRIELLTRTADNDEGVQLFLEAGVVVGSSPAGCPVGTTIIVRDLFYNTPARRKFMKTDRAEGAAISAAAQAIALSRPDISFRYIKDGKDEFHTPGDSKAASCIYSLLGREFEAGLIPVRLNADGITVEGYISAPSVLRGNRSCQFFFLNGRIIQSQLLRSALEQAYRNTLMTGRFPSCALYVKTAAGSVDVNVHPAKTEVKFVADKQFFDAVYYAALGALEQRNATAAQPAPPEQARDALGNSSPSKALSKSALHKTQNYNTGSSRQSGGFGDGRKAPLYSAPSSWDGRVGESQREYAPKLSHAPAAYPVTYHPPAPAEQLAAPAKTVTEPDCFIQAPLDDSTENVEPFRVIGEALSTYIITQRGDSVWFIDKHAAHERIHFDALMSASYEPMSEELLTPIVCHFGAIDSALLLDNAKTLEMLGFSIDAFGKDSIAVRSIPSDIEQSDVETVLSELCQSLERGGGGGRASLEKIYKSLACKAAIKAGSASDIRELEALAQRVMSGEISHCPHGRPTAFELTRHALEKGFGRV